MMAGLAAVAATAALKGVQCDNAREEQLSHCTPFKAAVASTATRPNAMGCPEQGTV